MSKQARPAPKSQSNRTVNIFDVLKNIDLHKESYYDDLVESDQKQLHPLVLTRWISGTSDPAVIQLMNMTSNRFNFSLAPHKPLLMQMLLVASSGKPRRYQWMPKTKETSVSKHIKAIRAYYHCSQREAEGYIKMHTKQEIADMARFVGWQDDEIKLLLK